MQQKIEKKSIKLKKSIKFFGFFIIFIVFIAGAYLRYIYLQIERGDILPWKGGWYTKEELAKKFPYHYKDVPAQNTPEEVYATFRQALLDGDIELALEQIVEDKRNDYRKVLIVGSEKFEKVLNDLPQNIVKETEYGNFAYYDIDMGTEYKNTISFVKDEKGFWKMENA